MIKKVFVVVGLLLATMVLAAQTASAATHRGHHGRHVFAGHARLYGGSHTHRHFAFRASRRHGYSRVAVHSRYRHQRRTYSNAAPLAPAPIASTQIASAPTATGLGLLNLGVVAPIQRVERSANIAARSVAAGVTQTVRRVISGGQVGGASYYGGRSRTASGGHVGAATCAHRSLPFGTRVLVTNLTNARQAVLTVNDRGPFVRGRIVDVSTAAAGTLGMLHAGTARVSVQVIGGPG